MENKKDKTFKERRIWYFECSRCGRKRSQSHKKKNAKEHICRICRMKAPPENQPGLFRWDTQKNEFYQEEVKTKQNAI